MRGCSVGSPRWTTSRSASCTLIATLFFFCVGGLEALLMRIQLARPRTSFLSPEAYNQLFTMHGTTMVFLVVMPMLIGFGNYLVPLMIGARDMAFPRLNALSFWLFIFGGLLSTSASSPGGRRRGLVRLRAAQRARLLATTPAWTTGRSACSSPASARCRRRSTSSSRSSPCARPGMTLRRLPLFVWMMLVTRS